MKIQGMMKKATVTAVAVAIAAGASGFAAAPASADTPQSTVNTSQGAGTAANESQTVPGQGTIISGIFYNRVQVRADGHIFTGNGGGLMTPGAGGFWGDLYTNDLPKLFHDTVSYEVNATGVYTNINFFDSSSHLLGHLQAGAVSTVTGIGGGTGSWS